MPWPITAGFALRSPDPRPIREIEQEITDEFEFHLEMRTLDNVRAGMSADEARRDAVRRFGDFERIHKTCRRTLLGERIMLQRVQTVLMLVLVGAVVFLALAFYRGQRANEAATATMLEKLERFEQIAAPSVVATVPKTGQRDVDPVARGDSRDLQQVDDGRKLVVVLRYRTSSRRPANRGTRPTARPACCR